MLSLKVAILAVLPLIHAQSSQIFLYLLDTDPQELVASVITANPTTTEYLLTCPSSVDDSDCGYRPPVTIGQHGSVYGASLTAEDFTMSYECTVYTGSASSAVCVESDGGSAANFPGVSTETLNGTDVAFYPVTITAGLEKLSGVSASATSSGTGAKTGSGTGSKATSTATSSGSVVTLSGTSSGSASKTGASTTASTSSSGASTVGISAGFGVCVMLALGLAAL